MVADAGPRAMPGRSARCVGRAVPHRERDRADRVRPRRLALRCGGSGLVIATHPWPEHFAHGVTNHAPPSSRTARHPTRRTQGTGSRRALSRGSRVRRRRLEPDAVLGLDEDELRPDGGQFGHVPERKQRRTERDEVVAEDERELPPARARGAPRGGSVRADTFSTGGAGTAPRPRSSLSVVVRLVVVAVGLEPCASTSSMSAVVVI